MSRFEENMHSAYNDFAEEIQAVYEKFETECANRLQYDLNHVDFSDLIHQELDDYMNEMWNSEVIRIMMILISAGTPLETNAKLTIAKVLYDMIDEEAIKYMCDQLQNEN